MRDLLSEEDAGEMEYVADMLPGVVDAMYDSFMGDIERYVAPGQLAKVESILKKYWPQEREVEQQITEIRDAADS